MQRSSSASPPPIQQILQTALAHHQSGQLAEAEALYRQVLQQQPQQVDALGLLGVLCCQRGDLDDGIALCRQAIALRPSYVHARENLGLALWKRAQELADEALWEYQQILAAQPDNLSAYNNLGVMLQEQGKDGEALAYYQQALAVNPSDPRILNGMAVVLQKQHKLSAAMHYHQRVLEVDPHNVEALVGIAKSLLDSGDAATCLPLLERALTVDPHEAIAHHNYGLTLLTLGDYERGFREYEWRLQTPDFPPCPFSQPVWDGSDLQGRTLLLHAEQGLGDTIQLIRYVAIAAEKGGRIILTCHAPLIPLFSQIPAIEAMVPLGQPAPPFDVYAPMMSLPLILGTTIDTVPATVPYLTAPANHPLKLETQPTNRLNVGLVWSGGHLYKHNHLRSTTLESFQPLLDVANVGFYSLQKGVPALEITDLHLTDRLYNLDDQLKSFADTAAAIEQLDLVITVDTSVAHLAGAMGKPVWLLLPHVADWRWMLNRSDTPWYPTMYLFRQAKPGDWAGLIQQVRQELRVKVATLG